MKNKYFEEFKQMIIKNPYLLVCFMILIGTGVNSIFNVIAGSLGMGFPYNTFLYDSSDRYADFFKYVLSFPDSRGALISHGDSLLNGYLTNNPYGSLQALMENSNNHFYLMPFSTLVALLSLKMMMLTKARYVYLLIILFQLFCFYLLSKMTLSEKLEQKIFLLSLVMTYPVLFYLTRGNIFSAFTTIALIAYLLNLYKGGNKYLTLSFFAIALNIRPNCLVLLICYFWFHRFVYKDYIFLGLLTASIFTISLVLANTIYPDYTFNNFYTGLNIYRKLYVEGDGGLAYGSSLLGATKVFFGYSKFLEYSILASGCAASFFLVYNAIGKRLCSENLSVIYLSVAFYSLFSSVFADYHLMIFIGVLILVFLELESGVELNNSLIVILISSVLMLIPKNYIFIHGISMQTIINPLVLVVSSLYVFKSYRNNLKIRNFAR